MPFILLSLKKTSSICLQIRLLRVITVSDHVLVYLAHLTFGPDIANILGTTKRISAKDSRTFAKEIAKYIDSKDQKRGKKDRKENEKEKEKGPSLMAVVRAKTAQHPRNTEKPKTSPGDDEPALWPLIRQVNVRCKAAALSTGAVLVDLPGMLD